MSVYIYSRNMTRNKLQQLESDNKDLRTEVEKRKEEVEKTKFEMRDMNRMFVGLQSDFHLQKSITDELRQSSRGKDDKIKALKKEVEALKEQLHETKPQPDAQADDEDYFYDSLDGDL